MKRKHGRRFRKGTSVAGINGKQGKKINIEFKVDAQPRTFPAKAKIKEKSLKINK